MKTDYRTKEDIIKARKHRDRCTIRLTILAITLIVGYAAIESAYAHRTRYSAPVEGGTIENISITNITEVTNITLKTGGKVGGGSGKGNIVYEDTTIDIFTINTAFLRLQVQPDDTAIGDGDLLGHLDFYADDDSVDADSIAGQIEVTNVGTRTDGVEGGRMELSVAATNGTQNNDQVVLNPDGTTLVATLSTANNIASLPQHWRFNLFDPLALQGADTQVGIIVETSAALTITNIKITLDASGNEVAGDLKYADAFIGLANPVVINVCDTTSGVIDDSSMGTAAVPSGKCVYFEFDSAPHDDITQMIWDVTWDYD